MEIDPANEGFVERSPLSVRAKNALRFAGFNSLLSCSYLTLEYLLSFKNIGIKTAHKILDYLRGFNFDGKEYHLPEDSPIDKLPLRNRSKLTLISLGYISLKDLVDPSFSGQFRNQKVETDIYSNVMAFLKYYGNRPTNEPAAPPDDNVQLAPEDHAYLLRILSLPLSYVGLSTRAMNVLKVCGLYTVLDLVRTDPKKLKNVENCGTKTVAEICDVIKMLGLQPEMPLNTMLLAEISSYARLHPAVVIALEIKNEFPEKYRLLNLTKIRGLRPEQVEHFMEVYDLYKKEGTLRGTGRMLNLTGERIRQILVRGTRLGLYRYSGKEYPYIEKGKILRSYIDCHSLSRVARSHDISLGALRQLLTAYNLREVDLKAARLYHQKSECIDYYHQIERKLGRPPTSSDLWNRREWRNLSMKIRRLWGSFESFRIDQNIPKPARELPRAVRAWQEKKKRLGLIIRMQYLDQIRDSLINKGAQSCNEIALDCGIKLASVYRLLVLLIATGEVTRKGEGHNTKYVIKAARS